MAILSSGWKTFAMIRPRLSFAFLALCGVTLFASSRRLEAQTNLGSVKLGSSTTTTVTIPLTAAAGTLSSVAVVTGGAANLDFTNAGGGTCVTGSAFSNSCTVQVSFAPKFSGPRSGAVVLADATGVVATVYLAGNGVGPQISFTTGKTTPAVAIPATLIGLPTAIAVDGSGNVYVGDSGYLDGFSTSSPITQVLKKRLLAARIPKPSLLTIFMVPIPLESTALETSTSTTLAMVV